MFALNIPSTFGDTIDCRINGIPKRVTWHDEKTLVIKPRILMRPLQSTQTGSAPVGRA